MRTIEAEAATLPGNGESDVHLRFRVVRNRVDLTTFLDRHVRNHRQPCPRPYPVYIEPGILVLLPELVGERLAKRRLIMIADETVNRLYDEWTSGTPEARRLGARASEAGVRLPLAARLTFPVGETFKTRASWTRLTDEMLEAKLGRDTAIVAVGGGVTGDLAGFVAATYLRGIPYVQVPTTLLAMVDASVGGKVGVNTDQGKNLVGAFHPPALVVADPLALISLPEREFRGGLAEAKHGLIADRDYFEWIAAHSGRFAPASRELWDSWFAAASRSRVRWYRRTNGRAASGPCSTPVIRSRTRSNRFSSYQLSHGEAVAIGLVIECRIAEAMELAQAGLATNSCVLGTICASGGTAAGSRSSASMRRHDERQEKPLGERALCVSGHPRSHERVSETAWTHSAPPETVLKALSSGGLHIST